MDAFESLVALLLSLEGYWVRTGYKVALTKDEKRRIERPSSPRWELDVVAYKGRTNEVLVVECKSFLDSRGVTIAPFKRGSTNTRYKLFRESKLWRIVSGRLVAQLVETGACRKSPRVSLCLATGRIPTDADREALGAHFRKKGWQLFDDRWVRERLAATSKTRYENEVALVASKLLMRK